MYGAVCNIQIFFHPDYTGNNGCYPNRRLWNLTKSANAHGLMNAVALKHRRWGISPRPEDNCSLD